MAAMTTTTTTKPLGLLRLLLQLPQSGAAADKTLNHLCVRETTTTAPPMWFSTLYDAMRILVRFRMTSPNQLAKKHTMATHHHRRLFLLIL